MHGGYYQKHITSEDVLSLSFRARDDHFELIVVQYDLIIARAVFLRIVINKVNNSLGIFIIHYLDKNLIYIPAWKKNVYRTDLVMERL